MKKLIIAFSVILSSCGYQGHYRYECQDPLNWAKEECNPPMCKVEGACSKDLTGLDLEEEQE